MANIQNELQKIFSRKSIIVYLALAFLLPLLGAFLSSKIESYIGFSVMDSKTFTQFILDFATQLLIPLFVLLISSELFAGEIEEGTLKLTLVRMTRFKAFFSKVAAMAVMVLLALGVLWLATTIGSVIVFGTFFINIGFFIVSWLPLVVLGIFSIFVSQWFENSGRALAFLVFLLIMMSVMSYVTPLLGRAMPSFYLDWYGIWGGSHVLLIMSSSIYLLSCGVLFFSLGYYKFSFKEV